MLNKETTAKLFDELAVALHDAAHMYYMGNDKKAKNQMAVADKLMEAIRLANGDDSWRCTEAHCAFKHNERGAHN